MPGTRKQRPLARAAILMGAATLAASCAPSSPPPDIPLTQGEGLLVEVIDSLYDAGRGASAAIGPDGTPAVSYLLVRPELRQGQIPPPVLAGQAQPPSVMLATRAEDVWELTSVTAQPAPGEDAVGSATEIANEEGLALVGVTTSLAIDSQGAHHVVWSTPEGLFYANDTGGTFSDKERVVSSPAFGGSIAAGEGGALFVSFYTGGSLRVAERIGQEWQVEEVLGDAGPAATPATVTDIEVGPSGPIVAFGDDGQTLVARRTGETPPTGGVPPSPPSDTPQVIGAGWAVETVGPGAYGISMDVDPDGNPHLAYYDTQGSVQLAHSVGRGPWDFTEVDSVGPPTEGASDARWSTGVAVDDQGVRHVTWADTTENRIEYATATDDSLEPQVLGSGQNGTNPGIAASADGQNLVLAWFDSLNANVKVAEPPSGELVLAHPTQRPGPPTATAPAGECEPEGGADLQIAAPAGASAAGFDKDCLAVEAATEFSVTFTNQDDAVPHNWTLYTDSSATERLGGSEGVQDPTPGGQAATYDVDALDAGSYFFRCDFHPATMTGAFVVP